jgi:hypothetical protein
MQKVLTMFAPRRMLDRQAEVYLRLVTFLRREDDVTFDSVSLLPGIRRNPCRSPVIDDESGVDIAVLAFASPEIRELKLAWNSDATLLAHEIGLIEKTDDAIKLIEFRNDYDLAAEVAHRRVIEIEGAVRTELTRLSPSGTIK